MKWREVLRFELAYQLRRKSIWVLFGLFLFPLFGVTMDRLAKSADGEILYNAPSAVAESGLLLGIVGLLIVAVIAGDAATRDSRTRLEPLMRAAPLSRAAYLGGRFAGSFLLAAGLMAMVPIVHAVVPLLQPEVAPGMVGPFRPGAYLQSYIFLLLPNAFVATALFFALVGSCATRWRAGSALRCSSWALSSPSRTSARSWATGDSLRSSTRWGSRPSICWRGPGRRSS